MNQTPRQSSYLYGELGSTRSSKLHWLPHVCESMNCGEGNGAGRRMWEAGLEQKYPHLPFLPLVCGVGLHVIKKWQHWSLLAWSSPLRILSCSGPDKCLLVYVCTHGSETRHRRAMLVAMHLPSSFSTRKMSEDPPWYFVVTWDYCI